MLDGGQSGITALQEADLDADPPLLESESIEGRERNMTGFPKAIFWAG